MITQWTGTCTTCGCKLAGYGPNIQVPKPGEKVQCIDCAVSKPKEPKR